MYHLAFIARSLHPCNSAQCWGWFSAFKYVRQTLAAFVECPRDPLNQHNAGVWVRVTEVSWGQLKSVPGPIQLSFYRTIMIWASLYQVSWAQLKSAPGSPPAVLLPGNHNTTTIIWASCIGCPEETWSVFQGPPLQLSSSWTTSIVCKMIAAGMAGDAESIKEVPYCFSRSSIKFQGHTGQNISDFHPNLVFPDCNSSFNSLITLKWCTKLNVL